MDFYQIKEREGAKKGVIEVYPDFRVTRSKDLMVRGRSFYAVWDEEVGLWSTDEYRVPQLVDKDIDAYEVRSKPPENMLEWERVVRKHLSDFSSNSWLSFRNYIGHVNDNSHQLDENLTFANTVIKKEDYVSRKLPYSLVAGDASAYDELISVLYAPEERTKLEWAVGAVMAGDSKYIQKFVVLYGGPGTGKSTFLQILQWLTEGYYVTFEAAALTRANNAFSTEVFKSNPLVAIQHDGDLSKIEDNTKLNSVISHEMMTMNEKYKASYDAVVNAFLFMGTNKPVKITDGKAGIIRRLIDVQPTGNKLGPRKYQALMSQIQFELGAIAAHCLNVYREMGKDAYSGYKAVEMMLQTDVFFNFIEAYYDIFSGQNGTTLKQSYTLYKEFCDETGIEYRLPQYKFREELKNYFGSFDERIDIDGVRLRSWYSDFNADRFKVQLKNDEPAVFSLVMDEDESLFDVEMAQMPAQYAKGDGTPTKYWSTKPRMDGNGKEFSPKQSQVVSTVLEDLDTHKEHYVKVPDNHIVIDFDLKDGDGNKSAERNLEAASSWPSTYAEFSKSEAGIHLHYIYEGDVSELSRVYEDGIEVKVFTGDSSLRRKLSKCNNIPVATISSGLPLKEKKPMNIEGLKSEKALRDLIERNLRKEIHPGTKSSIDFIHKILEDAHTSGLAYDVTDMRQKILVFAMSSSNQAMTAIKTVQTMKFASETLAENLAEAPKEEPLVFFDVEVFPNLFVICWKYEGSDTVVEMINPTAQAVEEFMRMKLIGFNNRRYDNHIVYAASLGYTVEDLYKLSKKLIANVPAQFGAAYEISYADIYEYLSKKQGLKKWQIELDLPHKELGFDWDKPVPKDKWALVSEYCANDVRTTEDVHHARKEDFIAKQILAELSGLPVNSTTQQHTSKIVFGAERRPQEEFVYTDLSEEFPGYKFELGKSYYRGEITGEGGYVYAEPGMYEDVVELDIASMHPTTIEQLNMFGIYTKNYSDLKRARIAIKHRDYDAAKLMLDGKLAPYLDNPEEADALAYALKIIINIVYGLTSAKFENTFRDPRNIDNIVAKRGALFMVDLKYAVQEQNYTVVHIKTDSIKIAKADKAIIDFVMDYGNNYGYTFEHEATYEKFCLVNDAVYVAKTKDGRTPAHWTATGAQFQHPYVFKRLFSKEPIKFKDMCEAKSVTTALYLEHTKVDGHFVLDFTDNKEAMALAEDNRQFIGKTGLFVPIKADKGGATLLRSKDVEDKETKEVITKYYAATGTTGFTWLEAEMVKELHKEKDIDMAYFEHLVNEAVDNISKYGDYEWFVAD